MSAANVLHDLAVQRACIRAMRYGAVDVIPARLMTPELGMKTPDALVLKGGDWVALEVELSAKFAGPLERALGAHIDAHEAGKWVGTYYISPNNGLLKRYEKQLELPIGTWSYSKTARQWFRDEPVKLYDPTMHHFKFHHDPELLKGFIY